MNTVQTQKRLDVLERRREAILSLGYDFIVFKSRMKKRINTLKKRIVKD